jgi:hypothetical protein
MLFYERVHDASQPAAGASSPSPSPVGVPASTNDTLADLEPLSSSTLLGEVRKAVAASNEDLIRMSYRWDPELHHHAAELLRNSS